MPIVSALEGNNIFSSLYRKIEFLHALRMVRAKVHLTPMKGGVIMEKILRLTRHPADDAQVAALKAVFGDNIVIVEISATVTGVAEVVALIAEHGATVFEAVLPLPILAEVLNPRNGISVPVIRAVMDRQISEDGTATFIFARYERVVKVVVETAPLA